MGAEGSLFAGARTIRDIGSYLPVDLGGVPYDREEHGRAAQAWLNRSQAPLPPSVESPAFFNNGMADQHILAQEIAPDHVRAPSTSTTRRRSSAASAPSSIFLGQEEHGPSNW